MTLLETFATTVELTTYAEIREALFHPNLSRTFDTRGYHEGNIRNGIVSTQHGAVHRARRRVENSQFRNDKLKLYERTLFPAVMSDLLDMLLAADEIDLYGIGEILASVLASRRAGLDIRERDLDELAVIVDFVDIFSQGAAILDSKDPSTTPTSGSSATTSVQPGSAARPCWMRTPAARSVMTTSPTTS
jgi:cytochrome P450